MGVSRFNDYWKQKTRRSYRASLQFWINADYNLKPPTKINILLKRYTRLYISQKRHIYNPKTKLISFQITIITETEPFFILVFYLISQTKSSKNLIQDDVCIPLLPYFYKKLPYYSLSRSILQAQKPELQ